MSMAPVMPFFTDAYLGDTQHLTTEGHGALLLLLLWMWRQNGAVIADNDVLLARIARLPLSRWRRLRQDIEPFFTISGGVWDQKKLRQNWERVQKKIANCRRAGADGATARRRNLLLG